MYSGLSFNTVSVLTMAMAIDITSVFIFRNSLFFVFCKPTVKVSTGAYIVDVHH
jgi:hypothetical protein